VPGANLEFKEIKGDDGRKWQGCRLGVKSQNQSFSRPFRAMTSFDGFLASAGRQEMSVNVNNRDGFPLGRRMSMIDLAIWLISGDFLGAN
jgi:hypothetical protein